MPLLLILIILLLLFGGGGFIGFGTIGGGIGLGTVLAIILIIYLVRGGFD